MSLQARKQEEAASPFAGRRICLLAPYPPRKGGVTVQTDLLARRLVAEGAVLLKVDTNLQRLRFPILGTPIRLLVQPWVVAFRLLRVLPKCEVLHIQAAANWGYLPAVIGVPLALLFRRRCVLSFQSGIGPIFMDRFGWLVKMPFRKATVATVCSRELQEAFRDRGIETVLLHNLYQSDLFVYRKRESVPARIVWTRSFQAIYDPMTAIKAFEIVANRVPNAEFTMTSDGPLMGQVRDYIRTHGIKGVTLTGRVPAEEVARLMAEAGVCLNTTIHDGLPTALLEAGASGLPIVTTNVGGIGSLFEDGKSAFLVSPGDFSAMADRILYLLGNPEKALSMGLAAVDAVKDYSWERASTVLADAYGFTGGSSMPDEKEK